MASATTQQQHRRRRAILHLAALLVLASPAAAASSACAAEKFSAGRSFDTCADLPALGATLHWTYDAAASSLSLAFAAKPAAPAGWVAWGVNPTGDGMKGAQTLVAFKNNGAYAVNTYNLTGYKPLSPASTPIAFKATELAADEGAGGTVRLYGTLELPKGMETVNHIWQVGSAVANGVPAKHAFGQENLDAKGKLVLSGAGAPEAAPAPAAGGPSAAAGDMEAEAPSAATPAGAKKVSPAGAASTTHASAPVLIVLLALAGFLAIL